MTISRRVGGPAAAAAGVCLLAGLLAGCTETRAQGLYEAKVVGADTDAAGRVLQAVVEVEFVIETSTSDETCKVVFYDAHGLRLTAPNSTTKEDIYNNSRAWDDSQYRSDAKRKYTQKIKVSGIPRTAKLDC